MTRQKAHIEAVEIGKDFGDFTALDAVSMRIFPGEFVTLLGPSGSGKTTLLMILAGFEASSRGSLLIDGLDKTTSTAETRGFGMVFQGYALFPHMSVADNIAFPLKVQKRSPKQIKARVDEMIDLVGLGGHGHKKPSALSGGQQQRVALARALSYEPPVLLLDEPFSALDKNLRGQMQDELRRIHKQMGTTFVFVTHDQTEALALSNRIAIFNQGALLQMDGPEAVYDRPANRFVAEFLGEINILPAEFHGAEARIGECRIPLSAAPGPGAGHIAIRPEKMDLLAGPAERALPCVIEDIVYMGAASRLHLRGPGNGAALIVDAKPAALPGPTAAGDTVWVRWAPQDSLTF